MSVDQRTRRVAATWDAVLAAVNANPQGTTNYQIAVDLNMDRQDVSHLTRLQTQAGLIRRLNRGANGSCAVYYLFFPLDRVS